MEANTTYYIYNYSVQPELLFRDQTDVTLFLSKFIHHTQCCAKIHKLMVDSFSFHACITFFPLEDIKFNFSRVRFNSTKRLSQQLGNVFNAYAQAYNAKHHREGNLFRKGFKHLELLTVSEFDELIESTANNLDLSTILT
jgi:hypothetical protein